jgi:hypothetical protein
MLQRNIDIHENRVRFSFQSATFGTKIKNKIPKVDIWNQKNYFRSNDILEFIKGNIINSKRLINLIMLINIFFINYG